MGVIEDLIGGGPQDPIGKPPKTGDVPGAPKSPAQPGKTSSGSSSGGAVVLVDTKVYYRRAGGIEYYRRGGIRPMVARTPTAIMGEAGHPEAYIPYERRYRGRAEALVAKVASDFGMVPKLQTGQPPRYTPTPASGGRRGVGRGQGCAVGDRVEDVRG